MINRNLIKLSALIVLMMQLTSCATMCNGTRQIVNVGSIPSGADVYVDSNYIGKTPLAVQLKRKLPHDVSVVSPGYQPQSIRLYPTSDSKLAINVLPGMCGGFYAGAWSCFVVGSTGAVGAIALGTAAAGTGILCGVDCLTGGGYKLSSDRVNFLLKPE